MISLPMARSSRQVRSCDLVRKRHGAGEAVKVRRAESEISARFIGILLSRYSTKEAYKYAKFAPT
jgi:hypothetical protein